MTTETTPKKKLIWEDPPPKTMGRRGVPWRDILVANPGRWARLPIGYRGAHTYKKPGFEITTRVVNGDRRVYGRYVGETMNGNGES